MRHRSIAGVILAGSLVTAAVAAPDLQTACTPDAIKLCYATFPSGRVAIADCMKKNWSSVGADCKAAVAANHLTDPKVAKVTLDPKASKPVVVTKTKTKAPVVVVAEPVQAPSPEISNPTPAKDTSMDWYDILFKIAAAIGAVSAVYYVGKLGLSPVLAKIVGVYGAAKTDLAALEARVSTVETSVGIKTVPGVVGPTGTAKVA